MAKNDQGYWSNRSKSRIERATKDSYHSSAEELRLTINVFLASFIAFWLLYMGQNVATSIVATLFKVTQIVYPDRFLMGYNRGRFTVANVGYIYATSSAFLILAGFVFGIWIPRKRFARSGIRALLVYLKFWAFTMAGAFMIYGMVLTKHFAWALKAISIPIKAMYIMAPIFLILLLRLAPYFQTLLGRLAISSEMAKTDNRTAFFTKFFLLPSITTLIISNLVSEFIRDKLWLFSLICAIVITTVFLYSRKSKVELRFHRTGTYKAMPLLWLPAILILVLLIFFNERALSLERILKVHLGLM